MNSITSALSSIKKRGSVKSMRNFPAMRERYSLLAVCSTGAPPAGQPLVHRRHWSPGMRRRDELHRIDGGSLEPHLEMQMRRGGETAFADPGDLLTHRHRVARVDDRRRQ